MAHWIDGTLRGLCTAALLLTACGDQQDPDSGTAGPAAAGDLPGAAGTGEGAAGSAAPAVPGAESATTGGTAADGSGTTDGDGSMVPGGTSAGAWQPPDAAFFPVLAGASWVYRHEGGSAIWEEEVSMSATEFAGAPAVEVLDTPGPSGSHTVAIFVSDGEQVRRVHKEVSTGSTLDAVVDYTPGFARFDGAWLGMDVGASMTLDYQRVEIDGLGAAVSDTPRSHTYEVMARGETVTVPAGAFDDCVQVRRERVRAAGTMAGVGDLKSSWFCADVGKVKEIDHGAGKSEVLISCSLPACTQ